jgi:protease-4
VQAVLERQGGGLGDVPGPVTGVAAAEEAGALSVNPAGIGFVGGLALAWNHESGLTPGARGDAVQVVRSLGPFGLGLGFTSVRPGAGPRWRKTTLGLSVGDGRSLSLGMGWNWFASPDLAIDRAESWDAGLTWRPWRHLSLSVAAMNRDLRVGGSPRPVRYDAGVGVRLWGDALTLTADVLGDDERRDGLRATHAAVGAGLELSSGLALTAQAQLPLRGGGSEDTVALVTLSWNAAHTGVWAGATSGDGWLGGARLSSEAYRALSPIRIVPTLDVERELEPRRIAFLSLGDPDLWGSLLERLARLRDDPEVVGVVLRLSDLDTGAGRAGELRAALAGVAARKAVLVWLAGADTRTYWVASAASAVAAVPGSALRVNGLGVSRLYLRDALARLGVAVEVVKVGAWKSAPEQLTRSGASPEAREESETLLDEVYRRMVADVAASRRLPPERVRALLDRGLLTAEEAKTEGLLDDVLWPDEVERWARRRAGGLVTGRYAPAPPRRAQRWGAPAVVEVVRVEGAIARGKSRDVLGRDGIAGAETVGRAIRRAAADRDVRAIVLRIESPGGDGAAGDLIWREVVQARTRKPVVASLGDVAASAGYLVAAGADAIVAEPSTVTGSIGVFALKPDLSGLLERLSIRRESIRRGENAELFSVEKPWSAAERAAVQRAVDASYAGFVDKVSEGRRLSRAEVEAVAGGRVWSGRAALERKLVDRLGSLEDAVLLARERAGLVAGDAVVVRRSEVVGEGLAGPLSASVRRLGTDPAVSGLLELLPEVRALALLAEMGPVLALPLHWVEAGPAR